MFLDAVASDGEKILPFYYWLEVNVGVDVYYKVGTIYYNNSSPPPPRIEDRVQGPTDTDGSEKRNLLIPLVLYLFVQLATLGI